ncbi:hypothetical protein D3C78_1792840 [compost metagenome]
MPLLKIGERLRPLLCGGYEREAGFEANLLGAVNLDLEREQIEMACLSLGLAHERIKVAHKCEACRRRPEGRSIPEIAQAADRNPFFLPSKP